MCEAEYFRLKIHMNITFDWKILSNRVIIGVLTGFSTGFLSTLTSSLNASGTLDWKHAFTVGLTAAVAGLSLMAGYDQVKFQDAKR